MRVTKSPVVKVPRRTERAMKMADKAYRQPIPRKALAGLLFNLKPLFSLNDRDLRSRITGLIGLGYL